MVLRIDGPYTILSANSVVTFAGHTRAPEKRPVAIDRNPGGKCDRRSPIIADEHRAAPPPVRRVGVRRSSLVAQTVPPATPPASPNPAGETVTLSIFEVRADKDVGYQAANTASGSRLNTALRDTAASITPLTREFLDDLIGLANFEPEFEDGSGFNAPSNRLATNSVNPFRVRGQGGGFSVDLVETGAPIDFSDIERVELSSGPNSILFGAGATGGTVTMSTKRANLQRHSHQLRWQAGSWNLQRAELDFNRVLAPGKACACPTDLPSRMASRQGRG